MIDMQLQRGDMPYLFGKKPRKGADQRGIDIGHGDGQAKIYKAGDAVVADATGHDAAEMR